MKFHHKCWFVIKFDQKHATKIDFSTEETKHFEKRLVKMLELFVASE